MGKQLVELRSVPAVLDALGGNRHAAALVGRGDQHGHNWRREGRFPANTYLAMTTELARLGFRASPRFWGMRESKAMPHRAAS